jgi:CheY-like chemotaxis protein
MGRRVLIVDDDEDLRGTLAGILEEEGHDVEEASDGAEALAYLRRTRALPDVILLDLMMPGMNGWQFREAQRRDPRLAPIPVVVLTASRTLHLNPIDAARIVYKPLDLDDLLDAVAYRQPPELHPS